LLFVPDGSINFPLERITIAWDASVQAVHALDAAAAFLEDAKDIQVLSLERLDEDTADPQRLVEYLAWRGLDAEARVVPRTHDAVGHALLSAAQEFEASLLVMGGYAHNRFEEAVFGGTTRHAIRHTHLPLLMMH
jgi:nucleotide-binding universal stress UspA family protein